MKVSCTKCGKEFDDSVLERHKNVCEGQGKEKTPCNSANSSGAGATADDSTGGVGGAAWGAAARGAAKGAAAAVAADVTATGVISMALPYLMSATGTVVSGVGTIQAGFIGPLAAFTAAPVAVPFVAAGAVVGAAVSVSQYRAGQRQRQDAGEEEKEQVQEDQQSREEDGEEQKQQEKEEK